MPLFSDPNFSRICATLAFCAYNDFPSVNIREIFTEKLYPTSQVPHLRLWKEPSYPWITDVNLVALKNIEDQGLSCRLYHENKNLFIVFRGTAQIGNWLTNLNFHQSELDSKIFQYSQECSKPVLVHSGFQNAYKIIRPSVIRSNRFTIS